MSACLACLEPVGASRYHARCLTALFGAPALPAIDLDLAKLHTAALAMVGRTSLSGVQRKISLGLTGDRKPTLQVEVAHARFILKPQAGTFPSLPENEHTTMRIASAFGIEVPACALIELNDGSLAYIVRRFDRTDAGAKLRQEDFCQLAQLSPKDKYESSAERCVKLVKRHATEPGIEVLKLYRLLLFSWWVGNGDMHLKNFSLLTGPDGIHRLAPAYDLLCTRLIIPEDSLALTVGGKKDGLTRRTWSELAAYAGVPPRAAEAEMARLAATLDEALGIVERSLLPKEMAKSLAALLRKRAK